jgi:Na+/H+-dicarboxylate symporter
MSQQTLLPKNFFSFKQTFASYYQKCALHIIVGIVLGIVIDQLCKKIESAYHINPLIMVIFELTLIIIVLYVIETFISGIFALEWQSITPGFLFVSLFFNLQTTLINNINDLLSQK